MSCAYLTDSGPEDAQVLQPAGSGVPAIAQGKYGSRGNLEGLSCAPDSGFTVCWFNSDVPGGPVTEPSIPAATWSAGLSVPAGRTEALAVRQLRSGPDFLEVVAATPEGLDRWTWSPRAGFERTDTCAGPPGQPFVTETANVLVLGIAVAANGRTTLERRSASLADYPRPTSWRVERIESEGTVAAIAADDSGAVHAVLQRDNCPVLLSWALHGAVNTAALPLTSSTVFAVAVDPVVVLGYGPDGLTAADQRAGAVTCPWDATPEALACNWSLMGEERRLEILERSGTVVRHHRWPGRCVDE